MNALPDKVAAQRVRRSYAPYEIGPEPREVIPGDNEKEADDTSESSDDPKLRSDECGEHGEMES
jgi:hypothetical protein